MVNITYTGITNNCMDGIADKMRLLQEENARIYSQNPSVNFLVKQTIPIIYIIEWIDLYFNNNSISLGIKLIRISFLLMYYLAIEINYIAVIFFLPLFVCTLIKTIKTIPKNIMDKIGN